MSGDLAIQRDDAALVEAARGGDRQAFAELYERYFDAVYDFVARMTRNREEAADLAQETFLKAMKSLGNLQEGARFKTWLFSIARNATLNHLERAGRTRPLTVTADDGAEMTFDAVDPARLGDPEEAAQAREMATLVWEAAKGLEPRQFTLLDLHLRQGLESAEIAEIMGVTRNNGYVMLNRLKKAVEESIGALLMLHDGHKYCSGLTDTLGTTEVTTLDPATRKRIEKHVSRCDECAQRRKRLLSPLSILGAFAPVSAPLVARQRIASELAEQWPGEPPAGDGPGGSGGGSSPPGNSHRPGSGWRGGHPARRAVILAASIATVAAVLLLFVPASPVALNSNDPAGATLPASGPAPAGDAPGLAATTTPPAAPTAPTTPAALDAAAATATPVPTASAVATATPSCTPALESTSPVIDASTRGEAVITLVNTTGCHAQVNIAVSAGEAWLSIAEPERPVSFAPSATRDIRLRINRSRLQPGTNSGAITTTASPGGHQVTVDVHAAGPAVTATATTAVPATATPLPLTPSATVAIQDVTVCIDRPAMLVRFSVQVASEALIAGVVVAAGSQVAALRSGRGDGAWAGVLPLDRDTFAGPWLVAARNDAGGEATTTLDPGAAPPCPPR